MKVQDRQSLAVQNLQKTQKISNTMAKPKVSLAHSGDRISFGKKFPMNVEETKELAKTLTNSTSGVRKIGEAFDKIVEPITHGVIKYCKEEGITDIVIANDRGREATLKASKKAIKMLTENGLNVHIRTKGFLTRKGKTDKIQPTATPLMALATKDIHEKTGKKTLGLLFTPSHNPWEYGGYNIVTHHAEIAPASVTDKIGRHMIDMAKGDKELPAKAAKKGKIKRMNPVKIYSKFINKKVGVDWKAIKKADINIVYDDLGGTGKNTLPPFFKKNGVKINNHISTEGLEGPNPVAKNLKNLMEKVEASQNKLTVGFANDGDVDRVGTIVYKNSKGKAQTMEFNDVALLIEHHMFKNRGHANQKGTAVIINQATSPEMMSLAEKNGAKPIQTPVGFKYIAEEIGEVEKSGGKAIIAAEESGGGTIHGNIPEKDGPVMLAMLTELVAKEKKDLGTILKEVKKDLPVKYESKLTSFKFDNDKGKAKTVSALDDYLKGKKTEFEGFKVDLKKTKAHDKQMKKYRPQGDGTKLYFTDGSNVLLRNSGTEPKTKIYVNAGGKTIEEARQKYKKLSTALNKIAEDNGGKK